MKINRMMTKTISLSLIIGMLLGIVVNSAINPTSTFYVSSGIYPTTATYTIFLESGNCFAKNAFGQIVYSSTNISYVINNAISSITTGKVFLKTGLYVLTNPIILHGGIWLDGEGVESTILSVVNTFDNHIIYSFNQQNVKVSNMNIYGNYPNSTAIAIHFSNTEYSIIDKIYVNHCNGLAGIFLTSSDNNIIQNCIFKSNYEHCILNRYGSDNNIIQNNIFIGNAKAGIVIHESGYCTIYANHLSANNESQILLWSVGRTTVDSNIMDFSPIMSGLQICANYTNNPSYEITVTNNIITNNGHHGIEINGRTMFCPSHSIIISNNIITHNSQHGIVIDNGYGITISSNFIAENGVANPNNLYGGVYMQDDGSSGDWVTDITITGNRMTGTTQKYGVWSVNSTHNVLLVGNVLSGCGTDGYSLVGSGNTIEHNAV